MDKELNILFEVERFLQYALTKKLVEEADFPVIRNGLLSFLQKDRAYEGNPPSEPIESVQDILSNLLDDCYAKGIIKDGNVGERDSIASALMSFVTPKQSDVQRQFADAYEASPMEATDYLYKLCADVNYINVTRLKKNDVWEFEAPYGKLECTISFARDYENRERLKPREKPAGIYPKCELCFENIGFRGNEYYPGRQNLRVVPLTLCGEEWFFQYSPHQYYNEHCLVTDRHHSEMKIREKTFSLLLDFVAQFPHYFMGSNADLPKIGDSFLSHNHFQGGCNMFPIEYAGALASFEHPSFKNVGVEILDWPVSVIRLESDDAEHLARAANFLKNFWKNYTDEKQQIFAFTEDASGKQMPHNTVTPIARKNAKGNFEFDIALRNNATSEERPYGIFCPGADTRHLNEGSIGIIGILGRGIYPSMLDNELLHIMSYMMQGKKYAPGDREDMDKHADWIDYLVDKYGAVAGYEEARALIHKEVGEKFAKALADSGVFKLDTDGLEGFCRFMDRAGFTRV